MSKARSNLGARATAAKSVATVLDGRAFEATDIPEQTDRGLILELCFGTLRYWPQLDAVANHFLSKPFKSKDHDIRALLGVGLYQLLHTRIPDHAAIGETVAACDKLGKRWAKGLVNAVLRNVQRKVDTLETLFSGNSGYQTAHPEWLSKMIEKAWPESSDEVIAAANLRPPMDLRVNLAKTDLPSVTALLGQLEIESNPIAQLPAALNLPNPASIQALDGFAEGLFSIQDRSAQRVAELVEAEAKMRVLDACSAPGGKTAHLLEVTPDLNLLALDVSKQRIKRVEETLSRLGLNAKCTAADASKPELWWDGEEFDRILVDAPCSGTGVIRRHPDIKLLRRPSDIEKFATQQLELLTGLWPTLKSGGLLVYATCSIMPAENSELAGQFMARHADCEEVPIDTDWGVSQSVGRQILPHSDGGDGFFFARFIKR